ncbi:MAG: hypothetical protein QXY49_01480 [Thermofilaceae archaeon]
MNLGKASRLDLIVPVQPLRLNDTISLAAEKMWEMEVPALPVVSNEGKYTGLVSIFSLLRKRAPSSTKIRNVVEKAPVIEDATDLISIARAFVRTGFPGLAFVKDGTVEGVVSARKLILAMGVNANAPAGLIMYPLEPLRPEDPIEKARKLTVNVGLRLVPVAGEKSLEGVVRAYDLVRYLYVTPLKRDKIGEIKGDVEYFLEQPVKKLVIEYSRIIHPESVPTVHDLAEGAIVVDNAGKVLGVISPYLLLRRLLPAVEEAAIPLRLEGLSELDFVSQRLIHMKCFETAKLVSERGRLIEMSVVLKTRRKGERARYEAHAAIKLDVGVHSASAEAWNPVEAAIEAVDAAYKRFTKTKERKRERRLSLARFKKIGS